MSRNISEKIVRRDNVFVVNFAERTARRDSPAVWQHTTSRRESHQISTGPWYVPLEPTSCGCTRRSGIGGMLQGFLAVSRVWLFLKLLLVILPSHLCDLKQGQDFETSDFWGWLDFLGRLGPEC